MAFSRILAGVEDLNQVVNGVQDGEGALISLIVIVVFFALLMLVLRTRGRSTRRLNPPDREEGSGGRRDRGQ